MKKNAEDYKIEDIIHFIKEEIDRIMTHHLSGRENVLREAQAFQIWYLHQEGGLSYEEAAKHVVDDSNDCGVDYVWIDKNSREVHIGQCEYDLRWDGNTGSVKKATTTFEKFDAYLTSAQLPVGLADVSRPLWQEAKKCVNDGYTLEYYYITPKNFTPPQEAKILRESGLNNYNIISHDVLMERGREFLDGQTGMCNFEVSSKDKKRPLRIEYEFGNVFILPVPVREIFRLVDFHDKKARLRAFFASNVRTFLSKKARSVEIGEAMRDTLKNNPHEFLICNNGITIQCSEAEFDEKAGRLEIKRGSISNGCQTSMNIHKYFESGSQIDPEAEVLVTVIAIKQDVSRIASEIARARNFQNPVDNRDLMSNNFRLVCLHHRLLGDRILNSDRRYYLIRKQGEKQTFLKEEPTAKSRYLWLDVEDLAKSIAAVIRQEPTWSTHGANELFGKYFNKIFPNVVDPSHMRCKYGWWLTKIVKLSYEAKKKWKGINDPQIFAQRDFKNYAIWIAVALIGHRLKEKFGFHDSLEKRFVEKAELWWFKDTNDVACSFHELMSELSDNAFRLIYSIARTLLNKKLPKAREPYTNYPDMLKGPVYPVLMSKIKRGGSKTYQRALDGSMKRLVTFIRNN